MSTSAGGKFGAFLKSGQHRAGKYLVSVWVEKNNNANQAVLNVNSSRYIYNSQNYTAGNWILKKWVVDVPAGDCYIYVDALYGPSIYFDDLMIRPVASSITGYVYNEWDELTHIIGNNGLATKFEYDAAGRLIKTYSEVIDDSANGVTGGFKPVKTNTYNNKYL